MQNTEHIPDNLASRQATLFDDTVETPIWGNRASGRNWKRFSFHHTCEVCGLDSHAHYHSGGKMIVNSHNDQTGYICAGGNKVFESDICQNYHGGNPNSEAAHKKARHGSAKAKQAILEALGIASEASCERLEWWTGLSHQTCSARISELKRDGKIAVCGTVKTRSGCSASVYKIL